MSKSEEKDLYLPIYFMPTHTKCLSEVNKQTDLKGQQSLIFVYQWRTPPPY